MDFSSVICIRLILWIVYLGISANEAESHPYNISLDHQEICGIPSFALRDKESHERLGIRCNFTNLTAEYAEIVEIIVLFEPLDAINLTIIVKLPEEELFKNYPYSSRNITNFTILNAENITLVLSSALKNTDIINVKNLTLKNSLITKSNSLKKLRLVNVTKANVVIDEINDVKVEGSVIDKLFVENAHQIDILRNSRVSELSAIVTKGTTTISNSYVDRITKLNIIERARLKIEGSQVDSINKIIINETNFKIIDTNIREILNGKGVEVLGDGQLELINSTLESTELKYIQRYDGPEADINNQARNRYKYPEQIVLYSPALLVIKNMDHKIYFGKYSNSYYASTIVLGAYSGCLTIIFLPVFCIGLKKFFKNIKNDKEIPCVEVASNDYTKAPNSPHIPKPPVASPRSSKEQIEMNTTSEGHTMAMTIEQSGNAIPANEPLYLRKFDDEYEYCELFQGSTANSAQNVIKILPNFNESEFKNHVNPADLEDEIYDGVVTEASECLSPVHSFINRFDSIDNTQHGFANVTTSTAQVPEKQFSNGQTRKTSIKRDQLLAENSPGFIPKVILSRTNTTNNLEEDEEDYDMTIPDTSNIASKSDKISEAQKHSFRNKKGYDPIKQPNSEESRLHKHVNALSDLNYPQFKSVNPTSFFNNTLPQKSSSRDSLPPPPALADPTLPPPIQEDDTQDYAGLEEQETYDNIFEVNTSNSTFSQPARKEFKSGIFTLPSQQNTILASKHRNNEEKSIIGNRVDENPSRINQPTNIKPAIGMKPKVFPVNHNNTKRNQEKPQQQSYKSSSNVLQGKKIANHFHAFAQDQTNPQFDEKPNKSALHNANIGHPRNNENRSKYPTAMDLQKPKSFLHENLSFGQMDTSGFNLPPPPKLPATDFPGLARILPSGVEEQDIYGNFEEDEEEEIYENP